MNILQHRARFGWITAALVVGAAITVAIVRTPPVSVETGQVIRGPFEQTIAADGKTRLRQRHVVSAPTGGMLERIGLASGDAVEAGQVIAVLFPPPIDVRSRRELEARLLSAEASLAAAQASERRAEGILEFAGADHTRQKGLADQGAVTKAELDQAAFEEHTARHAFEAAQSNTRVATHEVEAVRAMLSGSQGTAEAHSRRLPVLSPARGLVMRVLQQSEGLVASGTPLLEIGDPANLEVVVDVLTADAVRVLPGAAVRITRWGGSQTLAGVVQRVEPSAETRISALGIEEQRVNVVIDLVSPREEWTSLGDGFSVDAEILALRLPEAILAPSSAVFRQDDGWAAFVVADRRAELRLLRAGARTSQAAVIEEGLAAGEEVVVHPGASLENGARVSVRPRGR